jgi:hypothetical protein
VTVIPIKEAELVGVIGSLKNKNTFNMVISHFANWFHANWLILNVDRMNIVKFTQSNVSCNPLTIVCDSNLLTKVVNFNLFVCLLINI